MKTWKYLAEEQYNEKGSNIENLRKYIFNNLTDVERYFTENDYMKVKTNNGLYYAKRETVYQISLVEEFLEVL